MILKNIKMLKIFEFLTLSVLLIVICKFVNNNISIRSLYMDDLSNYYYFLRQNIFEYSFGVVENQVHYRPVFYFLLYIYFIFITGNIALSVKINIIITAMTGVLLYYISKRIKINFVFSILISIMFLFSRFSIFQIGQCIGIIDSVSLILSLFIFILCYDFIHTGKKINLIYLLFFLVCFTHERYMCLFVLLAVSLLLCDKINKKNKLKNFLFLILIASSIFIIRYILLGFLIPRGTAKTVITETFTIKQFLNHIFEQFGYILGFNSGPDYLCGIPYKDINNITAENIIGIYSIISLWIIFVYFIVKILYLIKTKNIKVFFGDIFFLSYILSCIIASSVTFRLEMRWIYSSYAVFLIYMGYMVTYLFKVLTRTKVVLKILFVLFFVFQILTESFYRKYSDNIYFLNDLKETNSLADETIYKFGEEVLHNKKIYITNKAFRLSGLWYRHFFEPFTGEKNEDIVLNEIENIEEVFELAKDENNIVLIEDVENKKYNRFIN